MSAARQTLLFVHPSDELYGSDKVLLEIVRGLPARNRYRAIVVLPTDLPYGGELSQALLAASAEVTHIDMAVLRRAYLRPRALPRFVWRLARGTWALARLVRRERVAVVHSNTVAVLCGATAAVLTRRPHVWDVHESFDDEPRPIQMGLRAALALVPGVVLSNSRASARSIVAGSRRRARRTRVVYYGIVADDHPLPPPRVVEPAAPLELGFAGRLTPRKGISEALEAAALLKRQRVPFRLRVFGTAPAGQEWREQELRQLAERLGIAEQVVWEGFLLDLEQRYGELDVLLVPSQRPEPFGRVLVEGMIAGCVVVACRNGGGSDEILVDGVTGLYCERDPAAIAEAVARLWAEPALRAAIAAAAPVAARERFAIGRFNREMAAIYDRLVAGR
jgi:glycosyltransferase involved in cell wall biosynthesis